MLSQVPSTPKCLKSTTDTDNYIYTLAGVDWYRYDVVAAADWEFIVASTEDYASSFIWKGDVVTVSGSVSSTTYFSMFDSITDYFDNPSIAYKTADGEHTLFHTLGYNHVLQNCVSVSTSIAQSGNRVMATGSVVAFDGGAPVFAGDNHAITFLDCCTVDNYGVTLSGIDTIVEDYLHGAFGSGLGNHDIVTYADGKWLICIDSYDDGMDDTDTYTFIPISLHKPLYTDYTRKAMVIDHLSNISYVGKEISIRGLSSNAVYYDGDIYIPGGAYSTVPYYKYNLLSGEYSIPSTGLVSNNRYDPICIDGTYLYKLVGFGSNIFYKCNLLTEVITELESIPTALGEAASMCYRAANNKIYVSSDKDSISSLWVYDISGDSWDATSTMPYAMDSALVVSGDDFVYVLESETAKYRIMSYNTVSDTWVLLESRESMEVPFDKPVSEQLITYACYSNGIIYCYSCDTGGFDIISVCTYDTVQDQWGIFLNYLYAVNMGNNFTRPSGFNNYGGHYITGAMSPDYFYTIVSSKIVYNAPVFDVYDDTIQTDRSGIYKSAIKTDFSVLGDLSGRVVPTARMQKTSPEGWVAPQEVAYLQTSPDGWVGPVVHPELGGEPDGWVAPIDGNLEDQPLGWVAPIDVDDREPEAPSLTPIANEPPIVQVPYVVNVELSDVTGTESISGAEDDSLYVWPHDMVYVKAGSWAGVSNCVVFEVTSGENYDCRLTAWDDVTHSTTINELLLRDICRVYAVTFSSTKPISTTDIDGFTLSEFVYGTVENKILKGNVSYYGDFDMKYRPLAGIYGDYLLFRPLLYGIDDTIPYGVHDHLIVLHYSYT